MLSPRAQWKLIGMLAAGVHHSPGFDSITRGPKDGASIYAHDASSASLPCQGVICVRLRERKVVFQVRCGCLIPSNLPSPAGLNPEYSGAPRPAAQGKVR